MDDQIDSLIWIWCGLFFQKVVIYAFYADWRRTCREKLSLAKERANGRLDKRFNAAIDSVKGVQLAYFRRVQIVRAVVGQNDDVLVLRQIIPPVQKLLQRIRLRSLAVVRADVKHTEYNPISRLQGNLDRVRGNRCRGLSLHQAFWRREGLHRRGVQEIG